MNSHCVVELIGNGKGIRLVMRRCCEEYNQTVLLGLGCGLGLVACNYCTLH